MIASSCITKNVLRTVTRTPIIARRPIHATSSFFNNDSKDDVTMRIKVQPIKRTGESLETKKARLIYQSRKRGILETDLLLSRFAAKYLKDMSPEELDEYDKLLDELDWDLYYWATENYSITPLPDRWKNSPLLKKLQEFSKNKEREVLRMPNLNKY